MGTVELHDLTATELAAAIRRRDVSAVEALGAVQRRIDAVNPALNAIVTPNAAAEAEARATDMVSKAIAAGNTNALNYFVAQKYIESLKAFAASPNQKVFFLPVEATSVIASIGGIAELAKDSLQKQNSQRGA